jgi:hypothetical protein
MKTNLVARRLVRVRAALLRFVLVGLVASEFLLGASMAARLGRASAGRLPNTPGASIGLDQFLSTVR